MYVIKTGVGVCIKEFHGELEFSLVIESMNKDKTCSIRPELRIFKNDKDITESFRDLFSVWDPDIDEIEHLAKIIRKVRIAYSNRKEVT